MVEVVHRARRRRRDGERLARAASGYAARGWPVCPGAHPASSQARSAGSTRACSCDRVGCPAPGAHPISPAWQIQASTDPDVVSHWWTELPQAGILLVTGRSFDVLDVPLPAGQAALERMHRAGARPGPVAVSADDRALFFVATRAARAADDEWWSCHLDCEPDTLPTVTGLRWHCRDSYVLAPPSPLATGLTARWVREPGVAPLPDALRLLEFLADACEEMAR